MPYLELSADFHPFYEIHDHTDPWASSETILLVHGFCESTAAWHAWIPYLTRHWRVISFDLRGFGRTGAVPADFRYETDLFVDDMVRIINRLAQGPVHVVASKSGAISCMRLAARRPDLVQSMVLTSAPLDPPPAEDWLPHMERFGMRSWARKTMRARMGQAMPERGIDWWVDLMGATALETAHAYLRWVAQAEIRPDVPLVRCPVLLITTQAPMRTEAETRGFTDHLASHELLVLPVDGYHASGAQPDACAGAAIGFLRRHAFAFDHTSLLQRGDIS